MISFSDIYITVYNITNVEKTVYTISLQQYISNIGNQSVDTLQYLLALLSDGKVRLHQNGQIERLSLVNKNHKVSRAIAIEMMENYLQSLDKTDVIKFVVDATQKIFLQKISL